ncbi:hypothetical protein Caci_3029 [Catenulispora acidiphila DSM 44928]|uniref:Uncharacterized protein n=1 Tax=Catenulispora acidiphila (strain DSM 44928 / JCM 14897 / NBRC 102108 / NRRL B-24433 / ID139908) TaxID=479433 RepID=C7Q4G9_CATAD|nr:hypothetical protein [Catenulispora acidiphila]ACU71938.1 hypothetical protein Caci_3029 [Catenulispora acidiphila DSM 44928]
MNPTPDTGQLWCPRRAESVHQSAGPDTWTDYPSITNGIGPCCSYCGSLDPDVFLAKVREGWIVEPTDKPTKAYLDALYTPEEIERIKAGSITWQAVRQLKLDEGGSEDEATAAANAHWGQYEAPIMTGRTVAKLYYQHLTPAQRDEFLKLHNGGAMRISWPGRFYVRPYFSRGGEAVAGDA